jgi:hypothetical protein
MKDIKEVVSTIAIAHSCRSTRVEIPFEIDGKTVKVVGRSTNMTDVALTTVEIYTPESTPQKSRVRDGVATEFSEAVEILVRDGTSFYTALRGDWVWPAIRWALDKPISQ